MLTGSQGSLSSRVASADAETTNVRGGRGEKVAESGLGWLRNWRRRPRDREEVELREQRP